MTAIPLLDIRDLTVEFQTRRGIVTAVQHVDLTIAKGETIGIVGESGSGKSVTSYAVMRILDRAGRIADDSNRRRRLDRRRRHAPATRTLGQVRGVHDCVIGAGYELVCLAHR